MTKLTPARALVLELIRRYLIIGMDCSPVEVQKLAYMLDRSIASRALDDPLKLTFSPNRYGPYADNLRHLLNGLDGHYLTSEKRIADSQAFDSTIRFNYEHQQKLDDYLQKQSKTYLPALDEVSQVVDGFESPYGMELLATVDWVLYHQDVPPNVASVQQALASWGVQLNEPEWGRRKLSIFDDKSLGLAIERLAGFSY